MELKQAIKNSNFHFNKRFGQNFIDDESLLKRIVDGADITKDDVVIEIGVGGGTLTREIAKNCKQVFGYEIDKNLMPVISQTLNGVENAEVIFKDFMKETPEGLKKIVGGRFTVIANLPYYITSPIVMKLLEEYKDCQKIIVMVQKEVADRYTALPDTPDYGSITASVDYYSEAEKLFFVGKENFYPMPNVDSTVIKLTRRKKYTVLSEKAFKEVLRIAFLSRRKTLENNFVLTLKLDRQVVKDFLKEADILDGVRGETLSTADFVRLADIVYQKGIIK